MVSTVITQKPAQGDPDGLFTGDQSNIDAEHFRLDQSLVASTPESLYFNNQLTPKLLGVEAFTGGSGFTTKVMGNSSFGQTGLIVRSTAGIAPGERLVVGAGGTREVLTVDVVASPTLLAMTTNLAFNHYPNEFVARGNRTHFEGYRTHMDADGGGDAYAYSARVSLGARGLIANPDQSHFSYVATAGVIDGDVTATASGGYLQFSEGNLVGSNYLGDHDVAAVGDVRSYQRNNDAGARGAVWIGNLQKSEGTKPCNAAQVVLGKWLGGVDLAGADFGVAHAAIKLAPDQRIYYDSTGVPDEAGYRLWSQYPGQVYSVYSSGLQQWQLFVNGACPLAATGNKLYTGANVNFVAGGSVSVQRNQRIDFDGDGGNTYMIFNGTSIFVVVNGKVVKDYTA